MLTTSRSRCRDVANCVFEDTAEKERNRTKTDQSQVENALRGHTQCE